MKKISFIFLLIFISFSLCSCDFLFTPIEEQIKSNYQVNLSTDGDFTLDRIRFYYEYNHEDPSKSIEVSDELLEFSFDAKKNDFSGRIKCGDDSFEKVNLFMVTKVLSDDVLDDILVKMEIENIENFNSAVENGFIILPSCVNDSGLTLMQDGKIVVSNNELVIHDDGTIVICISFKWGEKFNYQNPSIYYDDDPVGANISYEEVVETLDNLKNLLSEDNLNNKFHISLYVKAKQ